MAYFDHKCRLPYLVLVLVLLLASVWLPTPVCGDDVENDLFQGLNSYRTSFKLPPLTKNNQAACLADQFADQIEDHTCVPTVAANAIPADSGPQLVNYPALIKKCKINPNTTKDGIILPVCVPKLVPTLVLTNYTHTGYVRYINDSRFTGAGLGSENDWMVVVLTTNKVGGIFASVSGATGVVGFNLISYVLLFVLGLFLV